MRHVHICDPQLFAAGGHCLNHDAQLIRDLRRRNIPVSLYARKGCQQVCEGLTPEPIFSHDMFSEAATDPLVWPIENFNALNQLFLADLSRIPADRFTANDLVYFPNLLQNQLYAVALWLASFPVEKRPVAAVMLRFFNQGMDYIQSRANKELIGAFYRYAGRALLSVQPRSWLCADTRELAVAYQKTIELPVLLLPDPMDVSALLAGLTARPPSPRPVVIYQGYTHHNKGFHLLPDIIDACSGLNPRPRFLVQVQNRKAEGMGPALERLDRYGPDDVEIINGFLSADEYFKMFVKSDIVLLPYSPLFYRYGSSGVFTESASAGKVVVVSDGTVPARQIREYNLGGVIAPEWTSGAMAHAVTSAVRDLSVLQKRSEANAARFRRANCAQALWDKLFASIKPAPN